MKTRPRALTITIYLCLLLLASEFVLCVSLPGDGADQEDAEDDEDADPEHEAGKDGDLSHKHLVSLGRLWLGADLESEHIGPCEVDPEMVIQ